MCAGISSSESGDEGLTLPDQINKAFNDANNADAKAKQATMKLNQLKKTIKVSSESVMIYLTKKPYQTTKIQLNIMFYEY